MKPNMSIFLYLIWTFLRRRVMCVRFLLSPTAATVHDAWARRGQCT